MHSRIGRARRAIPRAQRRRHREIHSSSRDRDRPRARVRVRVRAPARFLLVFPRAVHPSTSRRRSPRATREGRPATRARRPRRGNERISSRERLRRSRRRPRADEEARSTCEEAPDGWISRVALRIRRGRRAARGRRRRAATGRGVGRDDRERSEERTGVVRLRVLPSLGRPGVVPAQRVIARRTGEDAVAE